MLTEQERYQVWAAAKSIRKNAEELLRLVPSQAMRLMALASDLEAVAENPKRKAG